MGIQMNYFFCISTIDSYEFHTVSFYLSSLYQLVTCSNRGIRNIFNGMDHLVDRNHDFLFPFFKKKETKACLAWPSLRLAGKSKATIALRFEQIHLTFGSDSICSKPHHRTIGRPW
jgi:hypothetical protein